MIENLALSGGGIKVLSFCGALWYINKVFPLSQIKRIIATSAGSIIALLLVCNFEIKEILDIVVSRDMSELKSNDTLLKNINRFLFGFGFNDGEAIEEWIIEILELKGLPPNLTFKELFSLHDKILILTTCHINTKQLKLLSHSTTPDLTIAEAIRMSMTFPLFFSPLIIDNNVYADGALLCNFPIDHLKEYDPTLEHTIGINLTSNKQNKKFHNIDTIIDFIEHIIGTLYENSNKISLEAKNKTITINTKEIDLFDFYITPAEKEKLFGRGYRAAQHFFKKNY